MKTKQDDTLRGAFIRIDCNSDGTGGQLLVPQSLTMTIQDVDKDSGRNADGNMWRNRLGVKLKYTITLPPCHTKDMRPILQRLTTTTTGTGSPSGNSHIGFIRCAVPNPLRTGEDAKGMYVSWFYVGDRTLPVYNYDMDLWNSISFDLIEG